MSSRNNPEMSQCSLDVPIVVKFSISLNWVVLFKKNISPLSTMLFPMSETFKKSQMSEFFDVSAGCSYRTYCFVPPVEKMKQHY